MTPDEITWNDEARAKILDDADRVLREAVLDVAGSGTELSSDEAYEQLNSRLKTQFIDYQPGPDVRRFADAIAAGEVGTQPGSNGTPDTGGAPDSADTAARQPATDDPDLSDAELADVKRSIVGLGE